MLLDLVLVRLEGFGAAAVRVADNSVVSATVLRRGLCVASAPIRRYSIEYLRSYSNSRKNKFLECSCNGNDKSNNKPLVAINIDLNNEYIPLHMCSRYACTAHKVLAPPSQAVLLVANTLRQPPRIISPAMGRGHGPMGPTKLQVCGQGGFKMDLVSNLKSRV